MSNLDLYQADYDTLAMETFVLKYRTLVKKIALYMKRRLPSTVELDDLLQSGLVGLLEAKNTYKNDLGASFETYASIRIKGSILDSLRKNSWISRDTLKNMRKLSETITKIEQRDQCQATSEKITIAMGISLDELYKLYQEINICNVMSLDDMDYEYFMASDSYTDPQENAQTEGDKEVLQSLLKNLSARDQQLLSLYYVDDFTFKQIGEILDLTEARICQLHAKLIFKIKSKLKSHTEVYF